MRHLPGARTPARWQDAPDTDWPREGARTRERCGGPRLAPNGSGCFAGQRQLGVATLARAWESQHSRRERDGSYNETHVDVWS
jgi:hypothetical protein